MNQLIKTTINLCTTAITLCTLTLSAQGQTWSGRGRVVDGGDYGTQVPLEVKIQGNYAIITYPTPEKRIKLNEPTNINGDIWEIRRCDPDVCAILEQPQRTIRYRIPPK